MIKSFMKKNQLLQALNNKKKKLSPCKNFTVLVSLKASNNFGNVVSLTINKCDINEISRALQ